MIRSFWLAFFGLTYAAVAAAQDTVTAPGAGDSGSLQEVVVTARRFSEDLQSVPIAVTALSASTMKLTDRLDLDAGLRWNEDDKVAHVYQADYASFAPTQLLPNQQFYNPAAVPAGFFPDPGIVTNYTGNRTCMGKAAAASSTWVRFTRGRRRC